MAREIQTGAKVYGVQRKGSLAKVSPLLLGSFVLFQMARLSFVADGKRGLTPVRARVMGWNTAEAI